MPRRKSSSKKRKTAVKTKSFGRAIWKGAISFGLVSIPVSLYSAEADAALDFDLLDKRDFSRVRYRRINEKTGREVPWDEIVKGYEYQQGQYVALTDEDFRQANVEATQSIDILDFVDIVEISPVYFDKPYYLAPLKAGQRAYALLREVMKRTGKVGIARVVIRTRQHLAALLGGDSVLVLDLLRFAHELRDSSALDVPEKKAAAASKQELQMAEQLVESLSGKWNPEKYRDDYHDDLLQRIDKKIESGQAKSIEPVETERRRKRAGEVIDIMHLLRQSVEQSQKKSTLHRAGKQASAGD